ncbi:hypothetical protein PEBR_31917 [Penicillium brasilianum]|uniref:Uncharacterized protein n=1 Tax=Penicillium brasilianum TaxID=104259 RepID=A0A1S9RF87_PENBI|nr:hypothetical protein PEBR_31917 [Penicillium brasilianum]
MRHFDAWVVRDPYSIWHYYTTGQRWKDTVRDLIHDRQICAPSNPNPQSTPIDLYPPSSPPSPPSSTASSPTTTPQTSPLLTRLPPRNPRYNLVLRLRLGHPAPRNHQKQSPPRPLHRLIIITFFSNKPPHLLPNNPGSLASRPLTLNFNFNLNLEFDFSQHNLPNNPPLPTHPPHPPNHPLILVPLPTTHLPLHLHRNPHNPLQSLHLRRRRPLHLHRIHPIPSAARSTLNNPPHHPMDPDLDAPLRRRPQTLHLRTYPQRRPVAPILGPRRLAARPARGPA